jgi:Bacterial toxin 44
LRVDASQREPSGEPDTDEAAVPDAPVTCGGVQYDDNGDPFVGCTGTTTVVAPEPTETPENPTTNWCDIPGFCETDEASPPPVPTPAQLNACLHAPTDLTSDINRANEARVAWAVAGPLLGAPADAAAMAFFASMEWYGQPWDWKAHYGDDYRDFGNYWYGYIGSYIGFNRPLLYCAAGIVQKLGKHYDPATMGTPCISPPSFGDDNWDHAFVKKGIDDQVAGLPMNLCK